MYRCEKDNEVLSILRFLQSKLWNLKQTICLPKCVCLFDPYYVKEKLKKKKKAKTQRKRNRNPRNSFYVEIRLPHLNAVKSRCEEATKAGQVSERLSASPGHTHPLSFVSKSAPESPSGTGHKFLLKRDNYTSANYALSLAFSRFAIELRVKLSMKL